MADAYFVNAISQPIVLTINSSTLPPVPAFGSRTAPNACSVPFSGGNAPSGQLGAINSVRVQAPQLALDVTFGLVIDIPRTITLRQDVEILVFANTLVCRQDVTIDGFTVTSPPV